MCFDVLKWTLLYCLFGKCAGCGTCGFSYKESGYVSLHPDLCDAIVHWRLNWVQNCWMLVLFFIPSLFQSVAPSRNNILSKADRLQSATQDDAVFWDMICMGMVMVVVFFLYNNTENQMLSITLEYDKLSPSNKSIRVHSNKFANHSALHSVYNSFYFSHNFGCVFESVCVYMCM